MNDGGPVFPLPPSGTALWSSGSLGMSLRDLLALAYVLKTNATPEFAYGFADRMISARDAASRSHTEEKS